MIVDNKVVWADLLNEAIELPGRLSEAYSMFHNYSLGNQFLAAAQLFERGMKLSPIGSFSKWKELGRSVKKGEKAISLVMPVTIKKKSDSSESDDDEKFVVFSLKKNWFSLDQTDGVDYTPEVNTIDWDKSNALSKLKIEEIRFEILNGNAQGYALPSEMKVAINPLAVLPHKTVFHELAHCLLHSKEAMLADSATLTKSLVEVEAEATAYLCCATLKLNGLEESRGYIQDWLAGNKLPDSSARRIFAAADKILKAGSK